MAEQTGQGQAPVERALARRGLTLTLLTTAYFFSYMDRQILAILQELIRKDLNLSDTQLGLLAGFAFAIFYATLAFRSRGSRTGATGSTSSPSRLPCGAR
jgi:hypothetical protein